MKESTALTIVIVCISGLAALAYAICVFMAKFLQFLVNVTFDQSYDYNIYLVGLILFITSSLLKINS